MVKSKLLREKYCVLMFFFMGNNRGVGKNILINNCQLQAREQTQGKMTVAFLCLSRVVSQVFMLALWIES